MKSCEALFLKPIAQSIPAMLSLWPRRCYVSGPCCVVESCSDNALSLSAIIMFTLQKMPGDNLQKLLLQGHLVSFWGRPGYLLPWRSCCGDSFDPCNQHHASFWNVNFIADRPAGYVSQQQREAFCTAVWRKRFVHSPQDLRGEGLGKAVGSVAPVGGTAGAHLEWTLPGLGSIWAHGSCWSPQGVSVMHNITLVGLPAWFNGLQLF